MNYELSSTDLCRPTGPAFRWTYALPPAMQVRVLRIGLLRRAQLAEFLLAQIPTTLPVALRAIAAIRAAIVAPVESSPVSTADQAELEAIVTQLYDSPGAPPFGETYGGVGESFITYVWIVAVNPPDQLVPAMNLVVSDSERLAADAAILDLGFDIPRNFRGTPETHAIVEKACIAELDWFERLRAIYEQTGTIDRDTALRFADEEPTYNATIRAFAQRALQRRT